MSKSSCVIRYLYYAIRCEIIRSLYRVFLLRTGYSDAILLPLTYIDKHLRNFEHLGRVAFIWVYVCFQQNYTSASVAAYLSLFTWIAPTV